MRLFLIIAFSTCFKEGIFAQNKSIPEDVLIGTWALTKYTETEKGEIFYRKIQGVDIYEPKTDSTFKLFDQNDKVAVYEFKTDRTFILTSIDRFDKDRIIGKWKHSDKDSSITLYDSQIITETKEPFSKSNSSMDFKFIVFKGLFLVYTYYDQTFDTIHRLYYKKKQAD